MKKPDKIYNLTIVYNEDSDNIEYIEETIEVDNSNAPKPASVLLDMSDYWDKETIKLMKESYFLAEA